MLTSLQSQPVPIFPNLDNLYDFLLFWYGKPCILLGIHVLSKWLPMTNCGCSSHSREFALQLKLAFKKKLEKDRKIRAKHGSLSNHAADMRQEGLVFQRSNYLGTVFLGKIFFLIFLHGKGRVNHKISSL